MTYITYNFCIWIKSVARQQLVWVVIIRLYLWNFRLLPYDNSSEEVTGILV